MTGGYSLTIIETESQLDEGLEYDDKLFTPNNDESGTVNYPMKSLRDYFTEIQRAVDYPVHGQSTYYVPKIIYETNNNYKHGTSKSLTGKLFSSFERYAVPAISHHSINDDNNIIDYNDNKESQYSMPKSISRTVFKGSNVQYSW